MGVHVVDADTDKLVKTFEDKKIGAITQTADGMVWYASGSDATSGHTMLHCINPSDLAEIRVVEVPGTISTGWGAWRSNNFFSATERQMLFWNGSTSTIESSGKDIYAWDTESDPDNLEPVYTFTDVTGVNENIKQQIYATMRYDDRSGEILFASTTSPNANYRYNWLNFYNPDDDTLRSVRLKDYYWFPAMPVFPDMFAPEMEEIEDIELTINDDAHEITLNLMDPDNIDANIRCNLIASPVVAAASETLQPVEATLKGNVLILKPMAVGTQTLGIKLESNGKVATHAINVKVTDIPTGAESLKAENGRIYSENGRIIVCGYAGVEFRLFDSAGSIIDIFTADSNLSIHHVAVPAGIYVISGNNGIAKKLLISK